MDLSVYQLVEPGNVVINRMKAWQGSIAVSSHRGVVSPDYEVLRFIRSDVDPSFFHYQLRASHMIAEYRRWSCGIRPSQWRLMHSEFRALRLFVPPLPIQRAIAAYLDRKTVAIGALIEKKERLIATLTEKRAALIHRAVTKGITAGTPMKDSKIPWVGQIPRHWTLSKIKFEFSNLNSRRVPLSTEERGKRQGDYPYYGASGVIDYVDDYLFEIPTILIAEDGANLVLRNLPLVNVATGKYWVNNHAHILVPRDGLFAFWAPLLESLDYLPFITGSTQPKLTAEAIGNVQLGVPPTVAERRDIAAYVDLVRTRLSRPLEHLACQVTRLREYRQALITAAVTGQIDIGDHSS